MKTCFENMRTTKAHISLRIRSLECVYIINLKMKNTSKSLCLNMSDSVLPFLKFEENYSRNAAN